jgi:hypothetical protein
MIFRLLAISLTLFSLSAFSQGRSPAVEDFVGIEVEEDYVTPTGTESLFNLQEDISRIEAQKNQRITPPTISTPESQSINPGILFGISLAMGLPLVVWFLVMSHLKKQASIESASNIEVLEKYRKERERKASENIRKAS